MRRRKCTSPQRTGNLSILGGRGFTFLAACRCDRIYDDQDEDAAEHRKQVLCRGECVRCSCR